MAPQLVPKYWLFRTVLLVLICTLIINGITLFLMAVPLPLGRALMKLIGAPQFLYHDPLHFVVGCVVCATSARTVHQRAPPLSKLKLAWKIFTEVETPLVSHG